jgi:hypothetical protein
MQRIDIEDNTGKFEKVASKHHQVSPTEDFVQVSKTRMRRTIGIDVRNNLQQHCISIQPLYNVVNTPSSSRQQLPVDSTRFLIGQNDRIGGIKLEI